MKTALAIGVLIVALPRSALAADSAAAVYSQPVVKSQPVFSAPQQADDFTLSEDSRITAVRFWGGYGIASIPASEQFEVSFFAGAADDITPDDTVFDGRPSRPPQLPILEPESDSFSSFGSLTGVRTPTDYRTFPGDNVFVFDLSLPLPVTLRGSETYFLSLTYLNPRPWAWSGAGVGRHWYRLGDTEPWMSRGPNLAFELIGTPIPEPSCSTLILVVVAIRATRSRRRR